MNTDELRKRYNLLKFEQKKEFILKLKEWLKTKDSKPHKKLLEEFINEYNAEVRKRNDAAGFKTRPTMPDIDADTFAKALATMLMGGIPGKGKPAPDRIRAKLLGKWQRDPNFYYIFNDDGTFETNEDSIRLAGNFSVSIDDGILMEPHDKLPFSSMLFSQNGDTLIFTMKNGAMHEYKKI